MLSLPRSLDGSEGEVYDELGRHVADFAIDDQRLLPDDPIYVVFENRDEDWEARLMAGVGDGLRVTLVWPAVLGLDDVLVLDRGEPEPEAGSPSGPRWSPPKLGFDAPTIRFPADERPSVLDRTMFRIEHPDL